MIDDITFAAPLAALLLPLPILAWLLLPRAPRRVAAVRLPDTVVGEDIAGGSKAGVADRLRVGSLVLSAFSWAFLVLALAGPQVMQPSTALPISGRELVLVLDFSGSMERRDFDLNGERVRRIDALKAVAAEFLAGRDGDRIGLVLFAELAMLASPATFDLEAVTAILRSTEIGTLGRSTAIGDGLGLALKHLKDSEAPSRAVILLSDGTGTAGAVPPTAAAGLAEALGIRVHTIALGTDDELSDAGSGSLVDEETLATIAAVSGGQFFRVRTTDDLRAVTGEIDRLEAGRSVGAAVSIPRDLWPWPAGAALFLMGLGLLVDRRRA